VTPCQQSYWLATADGGIFTFVDAVYHGSSALGTGSGGTVDISVVRGGYRTPTANGSLFTFGNAEFCGSLAGRPANGAVVTIAA
jgi:hypothetical protein